jgi:hypothetical protein
VRDYTPPAGEPTNKSDARRYHTPGSRQDWVDQHTQQLASVDRAIDTHSLFGEPRPILGQADETLIDEADDAYPTQWLSPRQRGLVQAQADKGGG